MPAAAEVGQASDVEARWAEAKVMMLCYGIFCDVRLEGKVATLFSKAGAELPDRCERC